jgi:fibronectin-binding autotransporter adhesin
VNVRAFLGNLKPNKQEFTIMIANHLSLSNRIFESLKQLVLMSLVLGAASAPGLQLTWDPLGNNGGAGSGNWDTTTTNTNWWNGAIDVAWTQVNTTTGSNSATFNGPDGPEGTYLVTNDVGQISVSNMYVNASGYAFYGSPLDIWSDGALSALVVAPGKTVDFYCQMGNANNGKYYVAGAGSVVNFFGNVGTSQPKFLGPPTSAFYFGGATDTAGVPYFLAPCYLTNGTYNAGASFFVGYAATAYAGTNYTNGSLTITGGATLNQNTGSFLMARGGGQGTITLVNGAINVGTTKAENVTIVTDNNGNEIGILNVYGGTLTTGSSTINSPILLSQSGSSGAQFALVNQTNGNIFAWSGITIGSATATSFTGGSAFVSNSGGYLYVGANGINLQTHYPPTNMLSLTGGVVGALANWACNVPITLATQNGNNTFQCADNNGAPYNITVSSPITGAGGFNVTGGGTLTLSGSNNYAGSTMVSNGTLAIVTTLLPTNGPVTVDASAGSPDLSVQSSPGQYWFIDGPLSFTSAPATLTFQFGSLTPSTTVAPIQAGGSIIFGPGATPNVNVVSSAMADGTYPLITYIGGVSGTMPANVTVTDPCGAVSGYLTNITASSTIALVVTNSCFSPGLYWAVGSGVWDYTTYNWRQFGHLTNYSDGNAVTFDDTASTTNTKITVTLNTSVIPLSIAFNNKAKSYTVSGTGSITGPANVLVQEGGIASLGCSNAYTGGTALTSGQLNINNGGDFSGLDSAIGNGPLTIGPAAAGGSLAIDNTSGSNIVLQPTNAVIWQGNFTYVGSSNSLNTGPSPVTMTNGNVTVAVNGNDFIVGGPISDNGLGYKITKTGNGALTLPVPNTFTGGLELNGGQINFGDPNAAGPGPLTFDNGTIIDNVSGGPLTLTPGTVSGLGYSYLWQGSYTYLGSTTNIMNFGSGFVSLNNGVTVTVVSNTLEWDQDIGKGNQLITKAGAGTLIIGGYADGNNALGMTVAAGVVEFNRTIGLAIANSTAAHAGLIVESNALVFDGPNNGNPQIGHGANTPVTLELGGIYDLNGNSETVDSLLLNGGVLQNEDTNYSQSTLNMIYPGGVVTLEGATNQINVGQTATLTINATITGSGSFAMNGPGTLTLTGYDTYTGQTTVESGTIALPSGGAIPDSTDIFLAATNSALDVSQSTNYSANNNPELTIQNGQILGGFGVVTGLVVSVSGATLAPGSTSTVGTLTVTGFGNDSSVLNGVTMMKLNKGALTSDQLVVQQGALVLGGTLALINMSGSLSNGDTFTLFNAGGGISGAFAGIVPSRPGYPGFGLAWNTNTLASSGTLSVMAVPLPARPILHVSVSGTTLTIQGSNGLANEPFVLLESTNVALPLPAWLPASTNAFDGSGNFSLSISAGGADEYFTLWMK